MQQMASAYGLLQPRGPQATAQPSPGPFGAPGFQAAWSWGSGASPGDNWEMEGNPGQPRRNLAPNAMHDYLEEEGAHVTVVAGATRTGSDVSSGQMPDALAQLLSAAKAASSEKK